MPALSGVSLGGGRGSTAVLAATITGADDTQNDLSTVACGVVVTDPTGAETYAWTLTDPRGVDRTALFDNDTIADPVFTPDQAGGGGQWVARVTVTRGSSSLVLTKVITIGQSGFVLARSIVSDGTTDATVSGGSIAWGGVTFAAPNTGVSVVDGDLVLTPPASTFIASSTRTAPLVSVSLSTLVGLTALTDRQVLIVLDVESYTPTASGEGVYAGLELASNPLGSGGAGRGVAGGQTVSTSIRAGTTMYSSSSSFNSGFNTTATAASIRGLACLISGGSVIVYSATTAYTDAAAVFATAFKQNGGLLPSDAPVTLNQAMIACTKPQAGVGATCTIRELQVWVR